MDARYEGKMQENVGSSRSKTFSPSMYAKNFGLRDVTNSPARMPARRSSVMDMFSSAQDEVKRDEVVEHDRVTATRIHGEEVSRAKKILDEEKRNEDYARKLEMEERDELFAEKLHRMEEIEAQKELERLREIESADSSVAKKLQKQEEKEAKKHEKLMRKQSLRDSKLAKKVVKQEEAEEERKRREEARAAERKLKQEKSDLAKAMQLQKKEDSEARKAQELARKMHDKDAAFARKLQHCELSEVISSGEEAEQHWCEPTVDTTETEDGTSITVTLPNVRRMEVDLDEEELAIYVNAVPKEHLPVAMKDAHDELLSYAKEVCDVDLKPVAFEIDLRDLVVIPERGVRADDITSSYDPKTGTLKMHIDGVKIVQRRRGSFMRSLTSRLGKVFSSSFSQRRKSKK